MTVHCPHCGTQLHPLPGSTLDLTRRERQTLDAIAGLVVGDVKHPAYHDICEVTGRRSKGRAHQIVKRLKDKGYVEHSARNKQRAIALTGKAWALYGRDSRGDAHVG